MDVLKINDDDDDDDDDELVLLKIIYFTDAASSENGSNQNIATENNQEKTEYDSLYSGSLTKHLHLNILES